MVAEGRRRRFNWGIEYRYAEQTAEPRLSCEGKRE
jgi:hypothetical protein